MTGRFEVVRTDGRGHDQSQPWHARLLSNGRIMLTSETYARMVGAERAILAAARFFAPTVVSGLRWNVEGVEKVFVDGDGCYLGDLPTVHYLDERSAPKSPLSSRRRADAGTPAPAASESAAAGSSTRASAATTGQGTPA